MIVCSARKHWVFQFSVLGAAVSALLLLLVGSSAQRLRQLGVGGLASELALPLLMLLVFFPRFDFYRVRDGRLRSFGTGGRRSVRAGGLSVVALPGYGYLRRGWRVAIEDGQSQPFGIEYELRAAACAARVAFALGIPLRQDCLNQPELSAAWQSVSARGGVDVDVIELVGLGVCLVLAVGIAFLRCA